MKLAIMQPYFFPYLGYWQLINAVDEFIIYNNVAYIKNGWINRNSILIQDKPHLITLPLQNASSFKSINEIDILNNKKNITNAIKTINMAYSKAPYFKDVFDIITNIFDNYSQNKIDIFNYNVILKINKYLNINTKITLASELKEINTNLKGQDKILEICKNLNAKQYINAIGGQDLYDKETFAKNNIQLNFIKMNEIKYQQFNNEFVPNLSIIDILMFNPPEKIKEMLDDYELI